MSKKVYAVKRGFKTGLFWKWYGHGGAFEATNGFKGAKFKGFHSVEEAEIFLKTNSINVRKKTKPSKSQRNLKKPLHTGDPNGEYYDGVVPPWDENCLVDDELLIVFEAMERI